MTEKTKEANDQSDQEEPTSGDILAAVDLVNNAIRAEEKRLKKIASTEEQFPISLEGYTTTGHPCQVMVDPKDVARILLEYNYPTWSVLLADFPDAMWEELGRMYGLESVSCVDI